MIFLSLKNFMLNQKHGFGTNETPYNNSVYGLCGFGRLENVFFQTHQMFGHFLALTNALTVVHGMLLQNSQMCAHVFLASYLLWQNCFCTSADASTQEDRGPVYGLIHNAGFNTVCELCRFNLQLTFQT